MIIDNINNNSSADTTINLAADQDLGKESFLNLLVTQLKYQDPLDPMENTEFVAQLSQFSSLEQLYNINTNLQNNAGISQSLSNSMSAGLIGRNVKAVGDQLVLNSDMAAQFTFDLHQSADVIVSILSDSGELVRVIDLGNRPGGMQSFEWDGKNNLGVASQPGRYQFQITAKDVEGNDIAAVPLMNGKVNGLKFIDGNAYAVLNGNEIPVNQIFEINE